MYFVIVGTRDNPIYEAEIAPSNPNQQPRMREENRHLNQFIVHAALDMVDEMLWASKEMYLKVVDKFNEWLVSAYVTATGATFTGEGSSFVSKLTIVLSPFKGMRFMLLHEPMKSDDIKNFFFECHELYLKVGGLRLQGRADFKHKSLPSSFFRHSCP